jgi:hypothetical protein
MREDMQLATTACICSASNIHVASSQCLFLQRIEAPVRNNDSADKGYAYDGKDISDRQNDVDRLLVDQDQPEEQRFLGTAVAFPDALRFKGAAPEIVNSRYNYRPVPHTLHKSLHVWLQCMQAALQAPFKSTAVLAIAAEGHICMC